MKILMAFLIIFVSFSYGKVTIKDVNSISTKQLISLLKKHPNTKIIDVRTRAEILQDDYGYIKANDVINIPRGILEFQISQEVKKNEKFVVYCQNGKRSLLATKTLQDMGYKKVLYYKDAFSGWVSHKLPTSSLDKNLKSPLYGDIKKIAKDVYVAIGITSNYQYESNAHNNNLGFIVGKKYVLVWNAGSSYMLAKALHEEIKKITNKKVKYVLLENSQGHAVLGSGYWKEQGAIIVSQERAKEELEDENNGNRVYQRMKKVLRDKFVGTYLEYPDKTFKTSMKFDLGDKIVYAKYFGYAHERSDIVLWLPKQRMVFGGDVAFNGRLLPIFKITNINDWLKAWKKFEALKAKVVIPGHGDVTDMKTVRKYTRDYLVYLQDSIRKVIEDDGDLVDAYKIDMSKYESLDLYKALGKQNIARTFKKLEFE